VRCSASSVVACGRSIVATTTPDTAGSADRWRSTYDFKMAATETPATRAIAVNVTAREADRLLAGVFGLGWVGSSAAKAWVPGFVFVNDLRERWVGHCQRITAVAFALAGITLERRPVSDPAG